MLLKVPKYILAGSLVVGAGALGWMAVDRSAPIEVVRSDVRAVSVKPGGRLVIDLEYVQRKACYIHSDRVLVDAAGTVFPLEDIEYQAGSPFAEIGKITKYPLTIDVPPNVAFGVAKYASSTVSKCNLLHWIWPIYSGNTFFFEVTPL